MMTREEKRGWWLIGGVNGVVLLYALACWLLLGCQPCPQIVATVTVQLDGGADGPSDAGAYCTAECTADAECAAGQRCDFDPDLLVNGVRETHGFCVRSADGGR